MLAALLLAAMSCVPLPTCTAALTTNCASPTPVVMWNAVPDLDLAGYSVYADGVLVADLPCVFYDSNGDDLPDARFCPGVNAGVALQRICPTCAPFTGYDFTVKAYDLAGNRSVLPSNVETVCFSPLCVRGTPCN